MRFPFLKTFLSVFLVFQLLTACGPTTVNQLTKDPNAKQLTAGEVLLLTKNNTLFIQAPKSNIYLYFDESGNAFGQDIDNNKDTGRWDVSEQGELCLKMNEWWFGKLRCYPVYKDASKYYLFNSSNVLEFTADHLEGDNKNLYYTRSESKRRFTLKQERQKTTGNISSLNIPAQESGGPTDEEIKSTVKWMAKDCPGCNLADKNLSGADLVTAKLAGANLSGANFRNANLRRADLKEANLENADFSYANMPGADLRDSDLTNTIFKGANLIRANFTGAKTQGANFEGALLESVEGLQK